MQLPSATFDLVRQAITEHRSISGLYDQIPREMTPHVLGWNKGGGEQALFFQFAGGSRSGLPAGGMWRCINLDLLSQVELMDGWYVGERQGIRPQSCVATIELTSRD